LKVDPGFIPSDETSEIVDLNFVELPESFSGNRDHFQFLTGSEGVRNAFEVCPLQVQFLHNQSLQDIVMKKQDLHNLLLQWM
jgi:hypothetical protein